NASPHAVPPSNAQPVQLRSSCAKSGVLQPAYSCPEAAGSGTLAAPMSMIAEAAQKAALDIRYAQVGLLQIKLRTTNPGAILDELTGKLATAPQFFQQTAICLDLRELEGEPGPSEVRGIIEAVQRAGMRVIGLTE